nr:putative reverse transcriptase domain-containing protein [Tanacetum cinerariifolium]
MPIRETDPMDKLARIYLKEVGDKVILKVSPWKGVLRFGKRGKLNPTYLGPFKVLERIRDVSYKLDLPEELSRVHNTFHVSNLKKCHADEPLAVSLDGFHFDDKLHFMEEPVEIVDCEVKRLKQSRIPLVKVKWNSKRGPEFTKQCTGKKDTSSSLGNDVDTDDADIKLVLTKSQWLRKQCTGKKDTSSSLGNDVDTDDADIKLVLTKSQWL